MFQVNFIGRLERSEFVPSKTYDGREAPAHQKIQFRVRVDGKAPFDCALKLPPNHDLIKSLVLDDVYAVQGLATLGPVKGAPGAVYLTIDPSSVKVGKPK